MNKLSHVFVGTLRVTAAVSLLTGASIAQAAGGGNEAPHDAEWVEKKVKACASCHGETGVSSIPANPILAGQYKDYLLHSLKGYRDGKRQNTIMAGQIKGLTDAQLKALARFYSKQDGPLGLVGLE